MRVLEQFLRMQHIHLLIAEVHGAIYKIFTNGPFSATKNNNSAIYSKSYHQMKNAMISITLQ